jgi:predicted GNAT family N-acyltransferase
MNTALAIAVKSPQECSAKEIGDFAAFVLAGGEVISKGLEGRVRDAHALLFLREDSCLVGIAALKRPSAEYRASVFKKACSTTSPTHFPLELGWVFVLPSARGRKLSHSLVGAASNHAVQANVFATSRTDNLGMHATMLAASFVRHGIEYVSTRGPHRLALFFRFVSTQ